MPKREPGVYPDAAGGYFWKANDTTDPVTGRTRQVLRRGYKTASQAAKARRDFLADRDAGRLPRAAKGLRVRDVGAELLDKLRVENKAPKTIASYASNLELYVYPTLGEVPLVKLNVATLRGWQAQLVASGGARARGVGPNTVRLARAALNGALNMVVEDGRLAVNPLDRVERPRVPKTEARHWTPEEARAFLASQEGDRLYPLWLFWLSSGLRPGEIVPLRWPSIDLDAGRVVVRDFVSVVDYRVVASRGKTKNAHRVIDLDTVVVKVLRQHRQAQAQERLFAGPAYAVSANVFTNPLGGSYHPEYLTRLISKLARHAGLPAIPSYGMRHTSATLLLNENVHDKVAAERLGHSDVTLFLNTYSHATATMQRGAAAAIGRSLTRKAKPVEGRSRRGTDQSSA